MATQSLEQYLERKRILEGSNPRSSSSELSSLSPSRNKRRHRPLREAPYYEPITQEARIPNLISLWRQFLMNPRQELAGSMEAIRRELLELEKNFGVVLLNPSVVNSAVLANDHFELAQKNWRRSSAQALRHAQSHANEALLNQMRSLLESYRTVAAYRIVKTRDHIEALRSFSRPPRLFRLHEEARAYFREARFHQNADNFNRARRLFRKAILVTEEIYLT